MTELKYKEGLARPAMRIWNPTIGSYISTYWIEESPRSSYSNPFKNDKGEVTIFKYDHDWDAWVEDDYIWVSPDETEEECDWVGMIDYKVGEE